MENEVAESKNEAPKKHPFSVNGLMFSYNYDGGVTFSINKVYHKLLDSTHVFEYKSEIQNEWIACSPSNKKTYIHSDFEPDKEYTFRAKT